MITADFAVAILAMKRGGTFKVPWARGYTLSATPDRLWWRSGSSASEPLKGFIEMVFPLRYEPADRETEELVADIKRRLER